MSGYIDEFVLVYLVGILIYSNNADEHELHFRRAFDCLWLHKLQAKLKNCEFAKPHVKYLGHVVCSGELWIDSDKVVAVLDWEPPVDIKGIQQFLGFANYYNCFIANLAKVAAPISNLLSGKCDFVWGAKYQAAFELLKCKLTSVPVLALPNFEQPFDLTYDALIVAVGEELCQGGCPVAFYSKKLTPAESRYHVTNRELMAVYLACMKWRHYLHGNVCHVYTDHEPLT